MGHPVTLVLLNCMQRFLGPEESWQLTSYILREYSIETEGVLLRKPAAADQAIRVVTSHWNTRQQSMEKGTGSRRTVTRLAMVWYPANVIPVEYAFSTLRDVDWSPESFDCLKLASETKSLLLSLAKTRLGLIPTVLFDDAIDGKGQGLHVLLNLQLTRYSGPPGVGKTFTGEATSEYLDLPLYSVSTIDYIHIGLADFFRYLRVSLLSIMGTPTYLITT
ncbi:hypothetical protein N7536_000071 [Penicillium majusculum]|nr:hypothetical protein N7536_000071 [Penicillium majusculum]